MTMTMPHKPLVVSSNLTLATLKATEGGRSMSRPATLVDWTFAPEWLTLEEAARLSGHDAETLRWIIEDGGVDTREEGDAVLIETRSLREFQESLIDLRAMQLQREAGG